MQLQGKHVLVTGAGKRVARCIAESVLAHGARLSAHYHRSKAEVLTLEGAHPVQADLRDVAAVRKMVKEAVAKFGPVDVLVNSASNFYRTPAETVTEAQWDDLNAVNVKGQFFVAQAVAETMTNGGVIVNIADVNAERPRKGFAPYIAAKGGLLALTRALALEWAPRIRVNAVSPGPVLAPESYTEEQREKAAATTLLGRWGTAHDIAEAVLFLVGNEYVTGIDLKVDGGRSIR